MTSEDKALSRNLREVLKTREDVEYYLNRAAGLAKRINQYPYKIELVRDLNLLLPGKTRLKQLTVSGNMVEIRGATPKGSTLLSALGGGEKIKNVRFTSRVRKDPKTGMELFSIAFAYESRREYRSRKLKWNENEGTHALAENDVAAEGRSGCGGAFGPHQIRACPPLRMAGRNVRENRKPERDSGGEKESGRQEIRI